MGFRNPVTTAADPTARQAAAAAQSTANAANYAANNITANQITAGAITGTKIAAGAIDGKTITGAVVRTGASGSRIVLDGTYADQAQFWTGQEQLFGVAGMMQVGVTPGATTATDAPTITIQTPSLAGGTRPKLTIVGPSRDKTVPGSVTVSGGAVNLGPTTVSVYPQNDTDVVRLVDLRGDTGWTNATYKNGWTTYNIDYGPARFRKCGCGQVEATGLVAGGTPSQTLPVFTFPTGYIPGNHKLFVSEGNNALARVDVDVSGNVFVMTGSTIWTSLDCIRFYAEH